MKTKQARNLKPSTWISEHNHYDSELTGHSEPLLQGTDSSYTTL